MENQYPAISIVIPIYNTGAYLNECVESILSQQFSDYELLLVDDGSTDNSIEIESFYAERYENVKVLHSNSGCVSSARNLGIEYAKGEYILFVDSDDYLLANSLKTLYETAIRFPNAHFIQAPFAVLSNGKITSRSDRFDVLDQFANRLMDGAEYLQKLSLTITYPWNSLIKRSFLQDSSVRFNPKLTAQEDLLFIVELFVNGAKGVLMTEPTYVYRFGRADSLTSVNLELTSAEITKRKKLLKSIIECSTVLNDIIAKTPQLKYILKQQITNNLTGVIGGSAILYPDKEIFNFLSVSFPRIPVSGSFGRKLLARLYNFNHNFAYHIRRLSL